MKRTRKRMNIRKIVYFIFLAIFLLGFFALAIEGPSTLSIVENRTRASNPALMVNISGGYISAINLTAVIQNVRWKAFVGWIDGKFTLDDAGGNTIFDWSLAEINGEILTTRNSSTIPWSSLQCASINDLESENLALDHTNPKDNITATFRKQPQTHNAMMVAGVTIGANSCPGTLNTYQNNQSQDIDFQEIALKAGSAILYATFITKNVTGYDGRKYDFQLLVPERGTPGFTGATPYYLYVELD